MAEEHKKVDVLVWHCGPEIMWGCGEAKESIGEELSGMIALVEPRELAADFKDAKEDVVPAWFIRYPDDLDEVGIAGKSKLLDASVAINDNENTIEDTCTCWEITRKDRFVCRNSVWKLSGRSIACLG